MRKLFLIGLILTTYCLTTKAEDRQYYNLSLDESIDIAREKSLSMLKLEERHKISEYNLQSATRSLKTNIDMSFDLPQYSDGFSQYKDSSGRMSYYSEKQLMYRSGLVIEQPLPTDGKIYVRNNLSTINLMDFARGDGSKVDLRTTRMTTNIGIEQPLNAFYGYNHIRSTLRSAKLGFEQSSKSVKRAELNLVYNVSASYYNLIFLQESEQIALLDLERQTEAYEMSKNKFAAGLIREVDALQMEVDLADAQNKYDMAIESKNSAVYSFKELIGVNLEDSISLKSDLNYDIVIVDPKVAVKYAIENRLEIREQEIQIELQKISIQQKKAARTVKASFIAEYVLTGLDQGENKKMFTAIKDTYSNFGDRLSKPNYVVGLSLNVPIFDWGENRSRVKAAESQLKETTYTKEEIKRSIETEVINLVANTNSNLKRLQLLEKSIIVAKKSFDITLKRYSDGDIDSESLALERNRLNSAYTSRLNAFINYQLSLADLMRKTFYDFKRQELIK